MCGLICYTTFKTFLVLKGIKHNTVGKHMYTCEVTVVLVTLYSIFSFINRLKNPHTSYFKWTCLVGAELFSGVTSRVSTVRSLWKRKKNMEARLPAVWNWSEHTRDLSWGSQNMVRLCNACNEVGGHQIKNLFWFTWKLYHRKSNTQFTNLKNLLK